MKVCVVQGIVTMVLQMHAAEDSNQTKPGQVCRCNSLEYSLSFLWLEAQGPPELGTVVFNTLKWILLTGLLLNLWYSQPPVTRSMGKHLGGMSFTFSYVFFVFVCSGILYLNDDFQGGGLFFTEMDTVTVTVSLGVAIRGREDRV